MAGKKGSNQRREAEAGDPSGHSSLIEYASIDSIASLIGLTIKVSSISSTGSNPFLPAGLKKLGL